MAINKRLLELVNEYQTQVDDLEDLYTQVYKEADVLREFIDFIYNARTDSKSPYTKQSLNYFSDEDKVLILEDLLKDNIENLLENTLVEN